MSWRSEPPDVPSWVLQYSVRRYGAKAEMTELSVAWMNLLYGAYRYHWNGLLRSMVEKAPDFSMGYYSELSATNITAGWHALSSAALSGDLDLSVQPLQYDIVDIGRQVLINLFVDLHAMYNASYYQFVEQKINTSSQLELISTAMLTLINDIDTLLGSNTNFLLGHWIADARASIPNTSPSEAKDNAELNARNQVTMWGPHQEIEDYAGKEWAGLVKDYHMERWALFTSLVNQAVKEGKTFDRDDYETKRFTLEQKFTYTIKAYPTTPKGDLSIIIKDIQSRYLDPVSSYTEYPNTDVTGNDITASPMWTTDIGQLKFLCNVIPNCAGFNSLGHLKSSVSMSSSKEGVDLYMKA